LAEERIPAAVHAAAGVAAGGSDDGDAAVGEHAIPVVPAGVVEEAVAAWKNSKGPEWTSELELDAHDESRQLLLQSLPLVLMEEEEEEEFPPSKSWGRTPRLESAAVAAAVPSWPLLLRPSDRPPEELSRNLRNYQVWQWDSASSRIVIREEKHVIAALAAAASAAAAALAAAAAALAAAALAAAARVEVVVVVDAAENIRQETRA
jgi:hypothetical protein